MAVKALYEKVKVKMARGLSGFGEIKLCHGASENGRACSRPSTNRASNSFVRLFVNGALYCHICKIPVN